jgi:signal transduction histidine kinase
MLYEFLTTNRDELISRCRMKVASRTAPRSTERELEFGIPVFLTQLANILRTETLRSVSGGAHSGSLEEQARTSATSHGSELLLTGFTVEQVVHDYGDLCQAVTEMAIERNALINNEEFQTLNRCLDDAIATAVGQFTHERDQAIAVASEQTMNERLGVLAHEFRNKINSAMLALTVIKSGHVGVAGSTGAVLERSLKALQELCDRALVDVRLKAGIPEQRERVFVHELIGEIEVCATIDAKARGVELVVSDVEPDLSIEVDRQILSGAAANLLQNAFKFTKRRGCVSLRAFSSGDRILIEVEDECGGLPPGDPEHLFRMFEQRSDDRSGLGLGLGISRRGVEANAGELRVRNLPGKGCVFTIDLPRSRGAKRESGKGTS